MASKSSGSTKPSIDATKITELLTRGVAEVYPSQDAMRAALMSGKRLRVYNGIDPTAATLHIGHLAVLQKLRQFQELRHEVIMLIGDFTGMIGDPTGKSTARKQLTRAEVLANARTYRTQASAVLQFTGKHSASLKRNSAWWGRMPTSRFFEICSLFTTSRLLERDMFQERLKSGGDVAVHEFLYPVLQAYDAVAMEVDVEIGGTDQTFNMLKGRDLVKRMQDREKFVITVPLLADASGKKIGKSEGNMVELGASAEDLFGQAMALPDGVIVACVEQCTAVPMAKVTEVRERLAKGENPRDLKMELASEFVRMRYGEKAADRARASFERVFQRHGLPLGEEIPLLQVSPATYSAVDLVARGFDVSRSEARRLILAKAVDMTDATGERLLSDPAAQIVIGVHGCILQKGKRHFVRIVSE